MKEHNDLIIQESKAINNSFQDKKEKMARKVTNLIAAEIISRADFPNENSLPRFYPTPFNNFGHYFLCDYKRLLSIVWDSIELLKKEIKPSYRYLPWLIPFVGLIFAFSLAYDLHNFNLVIFFFVFTVSLACFILITQKIKKEYLKSANQ